MVVTLLVEKPDFVLKLLKPSSAVRSANKRISAIGMTKMAIKIFPKVVSFCFTGEDTETLGDQCLD